MTSGADAAESGLPRRVRRLLTKLLGGVLVLALTAALVTWAWLRRSLPVVDGRQEVPGLEQPVEIVRDANAVPHVLAQTERDAYFGLGYAHAQDRLWQLEMNRRMGSGRLAELLGQPALRRDRLFRTLGLREVAARNLSHLDARTRTALDAYAAGVNAFLGSDPALPPEFALFRVEPEPWLAVDSLVWLKVMAWTLSGNLDRELTRWRLSRRLSPAQLAEFVAPYPGEEPLMLTDLPSVFGAVGAATGANLDFDAEAPDSLGSNNWAVDGRRSLSHSPLLANDPHLALTSPSLWYLAHLQAPNLDVVGATLPGLPGVILGRTGSVAWAFTNTGSDVQDLYLERLSPTDRDRYVTPDGSSPFSVRVERIGVRGGTEEELLVRETRHGPVISDTYAGAAGLVPAGYVLALRWTALDADDRSLEFVTEVASARRGADVLEAAKRFESPTQNVLYADTDGDIGFVAAGRVPIRSAENELRGLMPALGWDPRHDWQGYLPFEQLPQRLNPAEGRLVTANQKIVPEGYAHWLGADWKDPARAERIEALIDATPLHTVESFERIQADVGDGTARILLPLLLARREARAMGERGALQLASVSTQPAAVAGSAGEGSPPGCDTVGAELQRAAMERLDRWDQQMDAERSEGLIFSAWVRELARGVYADELGPNFEDHWSERPVFLANVLEDANGQGRWCDDVSTPERESCALQVRASLCRGLAFLSERHGDDLDDWRWGEAHVARSRHVPLTAIPVVNLWFDVVTPSPGGTRTVNAGALSLDEEDPFENRHGAAFRAVYDLGDVERSRFMLRTGQSGHVLSPHYRNWAEPWLRGESVPMTTRRDVFERDALGTLVLQPRR